MNGASLEEAYLSLYPQGETLAGTVSLALQADAAEGGKLELSYRVGDLTRSYNDYQQEEGVDGAFSGQITVTVDTSHNQRVEDFTSNGEVQVNWVEATPFLYPNQLHHSQLGAERRSSGLPRPCSCRTAPVSRGV